MRSNRLWLLSTLLLVSSFVGCDCSGGPNNPDPQDAGWDAGSVDAGDAGDGGGELTCIEVGLACSQTEGEPCCTGVCGADGRCPEPISQCKASGQSCASGLECCTNSCVGGSCSAEQCRDVGGACQSAEECCTQTCTGGQCATTPGGTCKVLGQACAGNGDCCSTNCQDGICAQAYTCQGTNDVCLQNSDCCTNVCSRNDGTAGRCVAPPGSCVQDGEPCSNGSNCCSRTCVDLGFGATVCQPVGGCTLTGNFCSVNDDCCGGGVNPNGTVTCSSNRCDNGRSCNGVGNICGEGKLPDGGIVKINAPQSCCDGQKDVCKVDSSGVPRCFGGCPTGTCDSTCPSGYTGVEPCCIASGNTCQFSDQCCGGALCLPGPAGVHTCQRPNCAPVGAQCTPGGGECCSGTECRATSELTYACQLPAGDGGTTCKANGTGCGAAAECCSGICNGTCQEPMACQPGGGICNSSADCCSGLQCIVPGGATSGTCEEGSVCSSSGQACSPTVQCCTGLSCRTSTGSLCDGTTACTCRVIIN